jgi:histidinol-phosphatase (PHP family)
VIEINTGGIARKYVNEQYPSTWILEEIRLRNIPVTINSDAHSAENIACMFDEMYELCKELGLENLVYLSKDGWKKIDL